MRVSTEVTWNLEDIEALLRKELEKKGLVPRNFGNTLFHWVVTGATEKTPDQHMEVDVTAICDIAQASPIPPGTLVVHPPASVTPPTPLPTNRQPQKILSKEELDELAKLLPNAEYADQILNSKAVIRDMMPGESLDRPT